MIQVAMPKVQKTIMLHDEIVQLTQAHADKIGTTFQRVIMAALLQHFFGSTEGVDPAWMSVLVSLEKGEISLAELPIKVWRDEALRLQRKIDSYRKRYPERGEEDPWLRKMESLVEGCRSEGAVWRSEIELYGGGLEGVIERAISSPEEKSDLFDRLTRFEEEEE